MAIPRFRLPHTAVLLVDVQERLTPHMHGAVPMVAQCARLLDGAAVLNVPVLVTEQYRHGLGITVPELRPKIAAAVCNEEKLTFSSCIAPIRDRLTEREIRSVLVCGIEAHVCVLQTCLDLIDAGYTTGVVTDAISSRRASDHDVAVDRMVQAGVVPTTVESALLELVHEAGTPRFKAILPIVK